MLTASERSSSSTHTVAHNNLQVSPRATYTLFWPPQTPGIQVVQRLICRQNTTNINTILKYMERFNKSACYPWGVWVTGLLCIVLFQCYMLPTQALLLLFWDRVSLYNPVLITILLLCTLPSMGLYVSVHHCSGWRAATSPTQQPHIHKALNK